MANKTEIARVQTNSEIVIRSASQLIGLRDDTAAYPRYGQIPDSPRQKWLCEQIRILASVLRERDFDAKDTLMAASVLDEEMVRDQRIANLILPEISFAFKQGVMGTYGDFYKLNVTSLWKTLQNYLNSNIKKESIEIKFKENKAKEIQEWQRQIQAEIAQMKADGTFVPTGIIPTIGRKVANASSDDSAHRELVRRQARAILAQESNNPESIDW